MGRNDTSAFVLLEWGAVLKYMSFSFKTIIGTPRAVVSGSRGCLASSSWVWRLGRFSDFISSFILIK